MKRELSAYAMQYFESFSTVNFSSKLVIGFTIFLNAIFMLPILIYKWWVGVPLALLYVFCMVKMVREQDRYAKGLLLWFSFLGFFSVSAILGVSYLYSIMYLSSIGIFSFLCTVFCVLAYEILFFVKLRKRKYSFAHTSPKKRAGISAGMAMAAVGTGRFLGWAFRDERWAVFVVLPLAGIILDLAISYLQRFFIYQKRKSETKSS